MLCLENKTLCHIKAKAIAGLLLLSAIACSSQDPEESNTQEIRLLQIGDDVRVIHIFQEDGYIHANTCPIIVDFAGPQPMRTVCTDQLYAPLAYDEYEEYLNRSLAIRDVESLERLVARHRNSVALLENRFGDDSDASASEVRVANQTIRKQIAEINRLEQLILRQQQQQTIRDRILNGLKDTRLSLNSISIEGQHVLQPFVLAQQ